MFVPLSQHKGQSPECRKLASSLRTPPIFLACFSHSMIWLRAPGMRFLYFSTHVRLSCLQLEGFCPLSCILVSPPPDILMWCWAFFPPHFKLIQPSKLDQQLFHARFFWRFFLDHHMKFVCVGSYFIPNFFVTRVLCFSWYYWTFQQLQVSFCRQCFLFRSA